MQKTSFAVARRAGIILVFIGIIHLISGFFLYAEAASGILAAGVFNTVERRADWFGFFWFETSGCFVLLYGLLAKEYISRCRHCLPRSHGYILLFLSGIAILLAPYSGFYLFLPVAIATVANGNRNVEISDKI